MNTYPRWTVLLLVAGLIVFATPVMAAKRRDGNKEPKTAKISKPDTVESVDAANWTLKISTGQKDRTTIPFTITQFTKIFVNGKPAKLEEVQKGMRVSVVSTDGKTASRVEATSYAAPADEKTNKKKKK